MSLNISEPEKNYYLNLREFANGQFEAILKAVRPMKAELMDNAINGTTYATACAELGESSRPYKPGAASKVVSEKSDFDKQQNLDRSLRRSKQNIRYLCKSLSADRLFTLTYRDNQTDRDQARADFTKFLRLVRSGWRGQVGIPNWQYVAVLEKQKRGAYHFHLAVKGFQKITFLRECWHRALGAKGIVEGDNSPGNVDVTNPDRARWGHTGRQWKSNKLVGYLTKYLSKTFDDTTENKRRFWHSRQIVLPLKQRFWIDGDNITQAIKNTVSVLQLHVGLKPSFNHWLSRLGDAYWISGDSDYVAV